MASGDNEHRMVFDIRGGRRGNVVKVVYAILAVLMGLSLFLVVGPATSANSSAAAAAAASAAEPYEEQAERIEVKLKKDPEDPDLLLALTRAQINAGNASVDGRTERRSRPTRPTPRRQLPGGRANPGPNT